MEVWVGNGFTGNLAGYYRSAKAPLSMALPGRYSPLGPASLAAGRTPDPFAGGFDLPDGGKVAVYGDLGLKPLVLRVLAQDLVI